MKWNVVKCSDRVVTVVQRFCDRGITSLALMSLSANCKTLRRTGYAIIGLVNAIASSDKAVNSSAWRSRPQISMLLDACRRALAISLVENKDSDRCPQLPGVSALFFARGLLVLLNPANFLFSTVNRTFLRIEKDHAARQQMMLRKFRRNEYGLSDFSEMDFWVQAATSLCYHVTVWNLWSPT